VGVGVEGYAIQVSGPDRCQYVSEIPDPIAARIGWIRKEDIPRRGCTDKNLVPCMACHGLDGGAALPVAGGVSCRRDLLAPLVGAHRGGPSRSPVPLGPRPLDRVVRLIADDPDMCTLRGFDEVRAAAREAGVVAFVGDRAARIIGVIEADDDAEVAVREAPVVGARAVVGVMPDRFGDQHPAGCAHIEHGLFAAGIMEAVEKRRITQCTRHVHSLPSSLNQKQYYYSTIRSQRKGRFKDSSRCGVRWVPDFPRRR